MQKHENIFFAFFSKFFLELIFDVLYFPVWWYGPGTKMSFLWTVRQIKEFEYQLGVGIWIKNIFVPMYGQDDWQGRLISFFMRVFQIIVRTGALAVFVAVFFALFLAWLAIPLLAGGMLIKSFL